MSTPEEIAAEVELKFLNREDLNLTKKDVLRSVLSSQGNSNDLIFRAKVLRILVAKKVKKVPS